MFLIAPRSKNNGAHAEAQTQGGQPVAKVRAMARVHAACDRCRMKKVKCDGYTPCLRCSQDEVICIASRKSPTSHQAASIEYIRSIEAQQAHLIKALTAVSRHVRQPVGEGELKEILDAVKLCGFDFERAGGQFTITKPNPEILYAQGPSDAQDQDNKASKKRKRDEDCSHDDGGPTERLMSIEYPNPRILDKAASCRPAGPSSYQLPSEPLDDYWGLDTYDGQVAASFKPLPIIDASEAFLVHQNLSLPSQDQADSLSRMLDNIVQSTYDPNIEPQNTKNTSSTADLITSMDSDALFSSFGMYNESEWDSILRWDPASLLDTASNGSSA